MITATRRRNSSDKTMATDLTSNCMMLLRTPQMLKKSGINKGNAMNYLAFVVRIVQVCAVKPRDVIGWKKEEPALIVVSWRISFHISNWYQFIFVYFIFENLILHIFLIIIIVIRCSGIECSGMFRGVPCSWFYRRPHFNRWEENLHVGIILCVWESSST